MRQFHQKNPYKGDEARFYELYGIAPTKVVMDQYLQNAPKKIVITEKDAKLDEPWDWQNQRPLKEDLLDA